MRKFLLYLHLYIGAVAALFLFLLGLTGAVMVFEDQIDHQLNKKLLDVSVSGPVLPLDELKSRLEAGNRGYKVVVFELPQQEGRAYFVVLAPAKGDTKDLIVNPYSGAVIGNVAQLNDWMNKVHGFHTHLSNIAGPNSKVALGWSAIALLFLAATGIFLWWPRKIFRWQMDSPVRRMTFDMHNALGFYSLIFMVLFAFTGAVIHWEKEARQLADKLSPTQTQRVKPSGPAPGAIPLGPSELLSAAQAAIPGARVTTMQFVPGRPAHVQMKFPEDHTPAGRSVVVIDSYTGKPLEVSPSRSASAGSKFVQMWNREIHTGDIGGWPTRILACFFSLMLCVMTVTGPIVWWNRQGRQLFGRAKSTQPQVD